MKINLTYYGRKAEGRCTKCGGPKESPVGINCVSCRKDERERRKKRDERAKLLEQQTERRRIIQLQGGLLGAPAPPPERPSYVFGRRDDDLDHLRTK